MVIISLNFGRLLHKVHEAVEGDQAECAGVLLEGVRESRHAACIRKKGERKKSRYRNNLIVHGSTEFFSIEVGKW